MEIVIGIGECAISAQQDDILITYGLGSCIAVTIYAPQQKVLGLAHIPLPYSIPSRSTTPLGPGRYVDTAIPFLLRKLEDGYKCRKKELVVNIFGGSDSARQNDIYRIGARNVKTAKSVLLKHNVPLNKEDTGGAFSRSIEVDVATGTVKLKRIISKCTCS